MTRLPGRLVGVRGAALDGWAVTATFEQRLQTVDGGIVAPAYDVVQRFGQHGFAGPTAATQCVDRHYCLGKSGLGPRGIAIG